MNNLHDLQVLIEMLKGLQDEGYRIISSQEMEYILGDGES